MVGYLQQPEAFVEIICYEKLLVDAKRRNAIFFDKIEIAHIDPTDFDVAEDADLEDAAVSTVEQEAVLAVAQSLPHVILQMAGDT